MSSYLYPLLTALSKRKLALVVRLRLRLSLHRLWMLLVYCLPLGIVLVLVES